MTNNNLVGKLVEMYTMTADQPVELWEKGFGIIEKKYENIIQNEHDISETSRYRFLKEQFKQTRKPEETAQSELDNIIKELIIVNDLKEYKTNNYLKEQHLKGLDRQTQVLEMQAIFKNENIKQGIKEYNSIRRGKQEISGNVELKYV